MANDRSAVAAARGIIGSSMADEDALIGYVLESLALTGWMVIFE